MQWFAWSALAREISRTNPSPSILSFAWRQRLILVHESVRWHFGGICDMWYRWYNQCLFQVLNSNEYIVLNLPIISWMLPCNYKEWWSRTLGPRNPNRLVEYQVFLVLQWRLTIDWFIQSQLSGRIPIKFIDDPVIHYMTAFHLWMQTNLM